MHGDQRRQKMQNKSLLVLLSTLLLTTDRCSSCDVSPLLVHGGEDGSAGQCDYECSERQGHGDGHQKYCGDDARLTKVELTEQLKEDFKLHRSVGNGLHDHHQHHDLKHSGLGLWLRALGCSLLVSLASLICLIILPFVFSHGKPSKRVVDSLSLFGAGAMLGDAFLHQLPQAFGGDRFHSLGHLADHYHYDYVGFNHQHSHSHAHSFQDLSIGLSILAGIVLFLIVEKVVRFVDSNSAASVSHSHVHHHHCYSDNKGDDSRVKEMPPTLIKRSIGKGSEVSDNSCKGETFPPNQSLLSKKESCLVHDSIVEHKDKQETALTPSSRVSGFLNLFSDAVHNFTDGMALGSAFLLYGSVGGWSRTLFLLAHELPQEVGDFGILVRSGFSVFKALFFNFLSALVALVGTAMALLWGQAPGLSSLIEGFTAGGFVYISVAVVAEINTSSSTMRDSLLHVLSLVLGMSIALSISFLE